MCFSEDMSPGQEKLFFPSDEGNEVEDILLAGGGQWTKQF